jgi:hypothetical protein
MKKHFFFMVICLYAIAAKAQNVGVGTSNPLNKLHVAGGLRLDTLTGVNGSGIVTHNANGVIYGLKFSGNINDVLRGDGTFGSAGSAGSPSNVWMLTGNSGTNPANNFLGTTDNQPLLFRVNNVRHGYLARNIFLGSNAGLANTGIGNIGIGSGALGKNTLGNGMVAIGDSALQNINWTTNEFLEMTAVGYRSLFSSSTGVLNTAVGTYSLESNTTGSQNTAIGGQALRRNTIGLENVAVGRSAMMQNISGQQNTAVGVSALILNTSGASNTAIGRNASYNNTVGGFNTAVGTGASFSNQSGEYITAVGYQSLVNNRASYNTSLGALSMFNNSTGTENVAVGYRALEENTTGWYNAVLGNRALSQNQTGLGNTAVGWGALFTITTGSYNTAIGFLSGYGHNPNTGNNGLPPDVSNVTCIGYDAGFRTTGSNQVNIGNFSVGWIGGNVGWGTYSDKRMKQDIKEDVPGIAFITRLKPVSYYINLSKEKEIAGANSNDEEWDGKHDIEKRKMTGFLAQDVELAANEIGYNFSGIHKPKNGDGLYSLEYGSFVVPLVKAVQEQQQIIEKQQKQIDELLKRIEALEKK